MSLPKFFKKSLPICVCVFIRNLILLGSYTMFSNDVKLVEWAKIRIPPFYPLYPIPFPLYWMNELTNKPVTRYQAKFPCHNIHVYSTYIFINKGVCVCLYVCVDLHCVIALSSIKLPPTFLYLYSNK